MTREPDEPKTIAEVRTRMYAAVREFRGRVVGVGPAERERYAAHARRVIERLRKRFRHKIDDMLRRDAKRHRGLNEGERLGLEEQLRKAAESSLVAVEAAVTEAAVSPPSPRS